MLDDNTAANNTFSVTDTLDGANGTGDVINIIGEVSGAALFTPAANISGIEIVNGRNVSGQNLNIDANQFTGATAINSDRSTSNVIITNVAQGASVGVNGDGTVANGSTTATYAAGATDGVLNISGGTTQGAIAVNGAGFTSFTINSTGAANTTGAISTTGMPTTTTVNAATSLNTGGLAVGTNAAAQSLVVAGAAMNIAATAAAAANGAVVLGALDADFATVDASGLTMGGIAATVGSVTQTITGGAGDDLITTGGVLTTGSVDAGGGTGDTLTVAASADLATSTLGGKYTNFENLAVNDAQTVDLDNIAGITGIILNDGAGATTVTDLSATQAGAVTMTDTNGAVTIGVKGATTVGQMDTVNITVSDGDTTMSETLTAAATPTLLGVETLGINAVDDAAFTLSAATAPALSNINLTGGGDHTLVTGNMNVANTKVDGSAATGVVNVDASGFATNGISITGGSGADILLGSGQADVIVGGAGKDTITGGDGEDVLTGGADADTFQFAAGDLSAAPSATLFDEITDFQTGSDIIDDTGAAIAFVTNAVAAGGTASINAEGIATFNAADDTLAEQIVAVEAGINAGGAAAAGQAAIFESGADSYVFISDGADGVGAADVLIKLTGVTGLADSTLTGGDLTIA